MCGRDPKTNQPRTTVTIEFETSSHSAPKSPRQIQREAQNTEASSEAPHTEIRLEALESSRAAI